jgi:sodium transport system permease protein
MKEIFAIFKKEIVDAMRDRRTLMMVLFSSLLTVPLFLFLISQIVSQAESQAEKRTILAMNIKAAPSIENFILRQGYQIKEAPADYEKKSRTKEVTQAVLLVPDRFDADLAEGKKVAVEIAYDTSNRQAEMSLPPLKRLLAVYVSEKNSFDLMMRGVSPEILQLVEVKEKELSRPDERKVVFTGMLPMVLIMAVVLGGMFAAIDSTAGERERGSLEPLMMNPVSGWQLAIGKSGAVTALTVMIVILTVLSFFPAQWLINNDMLKAEFQFGLKDAVAFISTLIPLAILIGALQVAVSLTCKNFKEAQVRNQFLSLALTMSPIFLLVNPGKEPEWMKWVPVMAQSQMMNQVLKGEVLNATNLLIAAVVCVALTYASLFFTAKRIRGVATM